MSDLCLEFQREGVEEKRGAREAAAGRGIEANDYKTSERNGGRFHYQLSKALQKIKAASPPVFS